MQLPQIIIVNGQTYELSEIKTSEEADLITDVTTTVSEGFYEAAGGYSICIQIPVQPIL